MAIVFIIEIKLSQILFNKRELKLTDLFSNKVSSETS